MKIPGLKRVTTKFEPEELLNYLESIPNEKWSIDAQSVKEGRFCFGMHICVYADSLEYNNEKYLRLWQWLKEKEIGSWIRFDVEEGKLKQYQQPTQKERCISFFKDRMNNIGVGLIYCSEFSKKD